MASTTPTAPAQVGKGQAVHYVRKDSFHSHTIGCGRLVATELTEQQAAGRKACGPCKRALEALTAEQPAEQAPATSAEDARAAKIADIERRVHPVEADTVTAATMFDPELTYYADGTRVVMRAKDTERTGTTFGKAGSGLPNVYAYQAVRWDDGDADLIAPHVLHRADQDAEAHRQELVTEVAARTLVLSAHATAHSFQPVDQPDGERIAWTFRTGNGASARYRWVSTRNVLSDGNGSEYRWQAEQAARLARRTGLDDAPMAEHIALVTAEPTKTLERMAAALDQDTVYAKEVGPGRWEVKRGGTFMGTVHDEGARMRRGRYAAWAPYAERRDGQVGFHHDLDAARDAVAKAWPVEVAEIAGELGAPASRVLEVAEQVAQEWKPEGRRAILRAEAYTGTNSRVTQAAADEIRQRLELPDHEQAARA
ncbi:hypothetical protein [Streptomyces sp. SAI-127]|uniref:hypothetical protein n=1 Tax=Streptomyces sp. SAI-127 TaxID=2940543 RepID=UPI002475C540|nr:hypothetical protein [Streptomyces sp. SAI-127]MDH6489622.1 hypothetical protein [Streptomyces sp. SAI-127]